MRILVYFVGKPRDAHAAAMSEEYLKRSSRYARCEMREVRPAKFDPFAKHASATRVALDPEGRTIDSAAFVEIVSKAELDARDLIFLIGGHDGLPPEWRTRADLRLSLSRFTMPHELARVVLAEQIYRALTTLRGHPYPR